MLQLLAYHAPGGVEALLEALDEEVEAVATGAATEEEVDRVVTTMTAQTIRRLDDMMNRALAAAAFEQQRSRAELLGELPVVLAAVTPDDVTRVARQWLQPQSRAVLEVVPGGER
jgi:predicted Zn-dependent peptidase